MDQINVQIIFEADTAYGKYRDALYIPLSQYEVMSEEQISEIKQERINNWLAVVSTPPEVTPEIVIEEEHSG